MEVTWVYLCLGPVIVVVFSSPVTSGANLTHHQHMAGFSGSVHHTGGVIALYNETSSSVNFIPIHDSGDRLRSYKKL